MFPIVSFFHIDTYLEVSLLLLLFFFSLNKVFSGVFFSVGICEMLSKFLHICKYLLDSLVNNYLTGFRILSRGLQYCSSISLPKFILAEKVSICHWIFISNTGDRKDVASQSLGLVHCLLLSQVLYMRSRRLT